MTRTRVLVNQFGTWYATTLPQYSWFTRLLRGLFGYLTLRSGARFASLVGKVHWKARCLALDCQKLPAPL
jgi:hypothetical protein